MKLFSIQHRSEAEEVDNNVLSLVVTHINDKKYYSVKILLFPLAYYEAYSDFWTRTWYRGWKVMTIYIYYYKGIHFQYYMNPIGKQVLLFTWQDIIERGYL